MVTILLITACREAKFPAPAPNPTMITTPLSETAVSDTLATLAAPNKFSQTCEIPPVAERRFGMAEWPRTNFCRRSVAFDEIRGVVGRDSIPAIHTPKFETVAQADVWLADIEPVLLFKHGTEARAYPIQILIWHEIVNDVVADEPVTITYCPLCNSGLVFSRRLDGQTLDFGVSGNLRNADLIMYDHQTESWWQQFSGDAILGELTGAQLTFLPSQMLSYADFKGRFPNGRILSEDTGYERLYGENPYINYDTQTKLSVKWLDGEPDGRLIPKMRVMGVQLGENAIAYPFSVLQAQGVINDDRDGHSLVVFWKGGTVTPLYRQVIVESRDVGSATLFKRELDGQVLTFSSVADGFVDNATGSEWNIFGTAVAGSLIGKQLTPIPAHEFFWFAWAAFHPQTEIFMTAQ